MGNLFICFHRTPLSTKKIQHIDNHDLDVAVKAGKITKILNNLTQYRRVLIIFLQDQILAIFKKDDANKIEEHSEAIFAYPKLDVFPLDEETLNSSPADHDTAVPELPDDTAITSSKINLIITTCRYSKFNTLQARIDSFDNLWPKHHSQSAPELADAGFFYTGISDRVICFHCGVGIKDWRSGDSPWVEHAVWFGNCDFLLAIKGQQFVEEVKLMALQIANKSEFTEQNADLHKQKVKHETENVIDEIQNGENNIHNNKQSEVDAMKVLKYNRLCKICFEKELSVVFLPCGHLSSCTDCAPKLVNCPICRVRPVAYVRAHLP